MSVLLLALLLQAPADDLAAQLRELDGRILSIPRPGSMLSTDAHRRIQAAEQRESAAWHGLTTKGQWEAYRDTRIAALRRSLGADEPPPEDLKVRITRSLDGPAHRIDNLVFESRPGLLVTANLYVPVPERASMPGILIVHSHHNSKTQSELQDMGVTWAQLGCQVLVMDQLGHGERRQHPFVDASSYPGSWRVGRQDYYFRYLSGLQLSLAGESLAGWMAWDLRRGVDLLLARPGTDPKRIILLGSVAGGGDPAAVAAALDPRITAVAPFNFGGPQPESPYPLPENAETSFNYAGGGSWESTRNLRLSANDGFLPWVIVGSVAPRRLIYGHEFSWDREHDPAWKRLEQIYGYYDAIGGLASATGRGVLSGKPPEASHCNNIGPEQRKGIHAALKTWFEIPVPEKDIQEHRAAADLLCRTEEVRRTPLHDLIRRRIREDRSWRELLGETDPSERPSPPKSRSMGGIQVEALTLQREADIVIPLLILLPPRAAEARLPVVVAYAQGGKQEFLKQRADELAVLLKGGVAVCLPDLRGTGETKPGDSRGRGSESTSVAATEFMLGKTLLGARLGDLRAVLRYLPGRKDIDPSRIALWGDSFAKANPSDRRFDAPLDAGDAPSLSEPLGGLLALFAGSDEGVKAAYGRGGLASYRSILDSPYCYMPYDALVPGALTAPDLPTLAQGTLRLEGLVDGLNRRVPLETCRQMYGDARIGKDEGPAAWLLEQLKAR